MSYEPLKATFTKEQMQARAQEWMRIEFGPAKNLTTENRERYHERLGFLTLYVEHMFSSFVIGYQDTASGDHE